MTKQPSRKKSTPKSAAARVRRKPDLDRFVVLAAGVEVGRAPSLVPAQGICLSRNLGPSDRPEIQDTKAGPGEPCIWRINGNGCWYVHGTKAVPL